MGAACRPLAVPLTDIPLEIGPYVMSRDVPIASDVVRVADVDSFLSREYVDRVTGARMHLYVGYWGRENIGMGHGPEVCFPAAGWQSDGQAEHQALRFVAVDGRETEAEIAIHHFVRIEPEGTERVAVGFVAVADGRFQPSSRGVFLHRPRVGSDKAFLAHIDVMMPITNSDWEESDASIVAFMKAFLPEVEKCLFGVTGTPS